MAANPEKIALSAKQIELAKKLDVQIDRIKINNEALSEESKDHLKYLLKDLYQEVPEVLPHLYVFFKDCVDRIEQKKGTPASKPISKHELINRLAKIREIVEPAQVITSKNLTGRDRDRYSVEFCENFEAVNLQQVGIGKIYVNGNGAYRVYEPNKEKKSIVRVCGGVLPALPEGSHWKEYLQKPHYQADVREAALNNHVFQEGPLVVSDKLPSRVRVWAKIEEYNKIVDPKNEIDAAEQAENLLRRLCALPLCVERERALVTVAEVKDKLTAAEQGFKKLKESTRHRFNVKNEEDFDERFPELGQIEKSIATYKADLIGLEKEISALGAGAMVDAVTLQSVVTLSHIAAGLSEYIDMFPFKKLNKAVIDLSKGVAPTPTQQIRLSDLKERCNIIQAKLTPVMNENTWPKIDQLDIPYTLDAFESMLISLENMLDEALIVDLNRLSDDSESEKIKQNIANILNLLPAFCKKRIDTVQEILEYFLETVRRGDLDEQAVADILPELRALLEHAISGTPNVPKIEKNTKKLRKKIERIAADTAANGGFIDDFLDDSKSMPKKRKKKGNIDALKADADTDTPERKSKWNIPSLFEDGGNAGSAAGGDILSSAVAIPDAADPAPDPMDYTLEGQSALWHALRNLFKLLQEPKGYEEVSKPRLEQYLEKLKDIEGNRELTVRGQDLWKTLNPGGAGFKAMQLLVKQTNGKNVLEEAIEKHEKQYLPQFQSQLSVEGNKYEVGHCFYIEKTNGILYLMRKDGSNPSDEELQDAFAKYQVICQDMAGSVEAKIYICNDAFTQKPEIQEKIAAIVNCLDLNLATDDTVPDENKTIQQAVQKFVMKMKDPVPDTADREVANEDMLEEKLPNYRVTLADGRCLLPASRLEDEHERIQYLSTVYTWEQRCKYLGAINTVNRVLPEVRKDSYRKEKTLVYLDLLGTQTVKELDEEMKKRTVQRKYRCLEERQIQAAIRGSLRDVVENVNGTVREEDDLQRALLDSLQTFELEQQQLRYLEDDTHKFIFQDVPRDGNCFYHAVADQMEQQGISKFKKDDEGLYQSLRYMVQGTERFKDGEWAGIQELLTLVQKAKVVIAVVDTRYPELGFRCYFRDKQGKTAETYYPSEFEREAADPTVIRLAFTGNHYMSVRGHNELKVGARRKAFNIGEAPALQYSQQMDVISERQLQLPSQSISTEVASVRQQSHSGRVSRNQPLGRPLWSTSTGKENAEPNQMLQHSVRLQQPLNAGNRKLGSASARQATPHTAFDFFPAPAVRLHIDAPKIKEGQRTRADVSPSPR